MMMMLTDRTVVMIKFFEFFGTGAHMSERSRQSDALPVVDAASIREGVSESNN